MSKKILILMQNEVVYNNFIKSDSFSGVNKKYELEYIFPSNFIGNESIGTIHKVKVKNNHLKERIRFHLDFLSMKRFSRRSSTFPLKYKKTYLDKNNFLIRLRSYFLSLPIIYEIVSRCAEWFIGINEEYVSLIKKVNPDLIIFPSYFNDPESLDLIRAAKKCRASSLMIMGNWDNVASKGVLRFRPDFLGVWGEQTLLQAIKIHKFKENQVHLLGSPQFDKYYRFSPVNRDSFAKDLNLDPSFEYILFLGMARWRDEIFILEQLEKFINKNALKNIRIIYRPHPWRDKQLNKSSKNFFDMGFQYINMEPSINDHYIKMMTNPDNYDTKSYIPDYEYSMNLIAFSSGVIASLTTMGIESMILGKNVLLPVFQDPTWEFSLDEIQHYEHHKCWNEFADTVICNNIGEFENSFLKFIKTNKDLNPSRIRDDVGKVVYNNGKSYSENLLGSVVEILNI